MNKKIASTLVGILLIGIVSAGLIPYLSNIITGSVAVEGPIFYLDSTTILTEKTDSGLLKLNDNNVEGNWFRLDSKRFYSEPLGVESFYPLNFEITLDAKVFDLPRNETNNEILGSCSVHAIIYQVSNAGGSPEKLCDVIKLGFDNENDYEEYKFSCVGESQTEINFNENNRFELLLVEQCPSSSYTHISLKGDSYIQVTAK